MTATERLDQIAARADACPMWAPEPTPNRAGTLHLDTLGLEGDAWNARQPDVVRFVAAARTDVPDLVAALRTVVDLCRRTIAADPSRAVNPHAILADVEDVLDPPSARHDRTCVNGAACASRDWHITNDYTRRAR